MKIIEVDNVNEALHKGLAYLLEHGEQTSSRNGSAMVAPVPVCTAYHTPARRVLFSPKRDCNPFFHLMEAIWMLAGRSDVAWPAHFAKNIANYSDNDLTFWGAYGHRWRRWFGHDQLTPIIDDLRKNKESRRAVLGMWDPARDPMQAARGGKDVPCNTIAFFRVNHGKLDMTVCNRSNDVIWGAYGANAVHFSVLHEFIAKAIGVQQGVYYQISNNFHVYTDKYPREALVELCDDAYKTDCYNDNNLATYPLMQVGWEDWLWQAEAFCEDPYFLADNQDPFFEEVARPMYRAWEARKTNLREALSWAVSIRAEDWRVACTDWLMRRTK